MKTFKKFTNENILNKMSPKSDKELRSKMGDKKYHQYKKLNDILKNIKKPFKPSWNYVLQNIDNNDYDRIVINLIYVDFEIKYIDGIWYLSYNDEYNDDIEDNIMFETWENVLDKMINISKKSLNSAIKDNKSKIDKIEKDIEEFNNIISQLNNYSLNDKNLNENMGYKTIFGKEVTHDEALQKSIRDNIINIIMDERKISEKSFKMIDEVINEVKKLCTDNPYIYKKAQEYYNNNKRLMFLAEEIYDKFYN